MTIAQIAYIAAGYETLMAERMHEACIRTALRLGILDATMGEFEKLCKSAAYRAEVLGGSYA